MSKNHLAALPLGGVGEIGMNMMVYECNGDIIVVDCGVSFADESNPGVDIIVPDTRYLREHAKHIKAIIITHGHEDHIGGIGYLWDEFAGAPVYATPFSRLIMEGKLHELGIKPQKGQINTAKPGEKYQISANFNIEFVPVAHSVPESNALAIRTPYGTIVHTGDYKFDESPPFGHKTDEKRLKEIGDEGVLAMLGDSTNVFRQTPSGNEGDISPHLAEIIRAAKNRVFFAAFASNIGRVLEAARVAAECGRKICFLGRTVNKMLTHTKALGYFPAGLANHIVEADEMKGLPANKVMVFASGTQGETEASLSRLSRGMDVRGIKIGAGDTVVLSSKMIPGNERKILNVINGIYKLNANIISEMNDHGIHVSGHGSKPEIERMYKLLRPRYVVPVHGEPAHLIEQQRLAEKNGIKAVRTQNGSKLVLAPEEPHVQQHAYPHGLNYIDGLNILEHDPLVLKERRKLSYDGVVTAAMALRQTNGEMVSDLTLATRGLIDERLQAELMQRATDGATKALETVFPDGLVDDRNRAAEVVTQAVRRAFKLHRGKTPTVLVQFVDV